jgi:hypothetical protein
MIEIDPDAYRYQALVLANNQHDSTKDVVERAEQYFKFLTAD